MDELLAMSPRLAQLCEPCAGGLFDGGMVKDHFLGDLGMMPSQALVPAQGTASFPPFMTRASDHANAVPGLFSYPAHPSKRARV